jgi:parallel beta-helix repeat protein
MQLWRRFCFLVFTVICLYLGFFQFKVSAQTNFPVHNLNTDRFYATINEAILDNATLDGHVIEVGAGVYYENVVLTKAVSLVGENRSNTIIDGQGNGTVIDILTSNVSVAGFTIRNGGSVSGRSGVHIKGSSFCKILDNIIEGNWWGIYIESCSNITVSNNNITINSYGVNVYSSLNVLITENEFLMNDYAVWMSGVEDFDFLLNNVSNNGHGIWMTQSTNAILNGNRILDNADGVLIYYSNNTLLLENVIFSNEGNAIYLGGCANTSIFGCQIFSSGETAVRIIYSTGNNLTENNISSEGFDGVYLQQSSGNFVYFNNVSDCGRALAFYWCVSNIISANTLMRNGLGIVLSSSDAKVFGNDVSGNGYGVFVNNSTGVEVRENNVVGNGDGLHFKDCFGNYVFNNTLSFNAGFGLVLNSSDNCSVSGNSFLRNSVGLCLEFAEGNVVANNSFYENDYGVFVKKSSNDSIVFNRLFANDVGAALFSCVNVTVLYNEFVDNNVGFVFNMSIANGFYNNVLDRNKDGVRVVSSFNNTCMFNVVSSNVGFGVYVLNSSFNVFLYNSFFNNSLVGSFNSSNFWDDGVEGNFWGYEGFVDDDRDGLGDFAFVIGEGERDNFPLMGEYARFFVNVDDNRYLVSVVSNSSVSHFVYFRDPKNLTSVVSFKVGVSEGLGFCRVCLPNALVQPPFEVRVDNAAPLYYGVVKANATHSWLYFAFPYIGGDVRIVTAVGGAPFWSEFWFWGIVGLAVVVGFLAIAVFLFYRRLSLYRKRIEEFERRLRERELSPLEVARRFFSADVERRSVKIGKFEEKYGVKIRPRDSLEDILRVLESKQKEKKDEEAE